ncbi:MAG: hypothetical protein ABI780_01925 [Ardenticatenales bacterium]
MADPRAADPTPRQAWHRHRYLKFGFIEDLDRTRHIAVGRLWSVVIAVTPTVWLQGPLFFLLGLALSFVPGRVPPGAGLAIRAADVLTFLVAGLVANTVHGFGHIVSGTLAGSAMDELLFTATRDANIYRGDQSGIRGRTHVARAIGGPAANLIVAALAYAVMAAVGGGGHPWLARIGSVNLLFGLGGLLPVPSVDGEVIWRVAWRGRAD